MNSVILSHLQVNQAIREVFKKTSRMTKNMKNFWKILLCVIGVIVLVCLVLFIINQIGASNSENLQSEQQKV